MRVIPFRDTRDDALGFRQTGTPRRVCVVGLGYIGLPTAAILARRGHQVFGVDVREDVVETINRGEIHIHEPGLGELVSDVVAQGRLVAGTRPQQADVFIICVPTPINSDHSPDVSCVAQASNAIRPYVREGNQVILESTSPPGTTIDVVVRHALPANLALGKEVFVAYCPERVLPGRILTELIENDRIVGGVTPACTDEVAEFYDSFVEGAVLRTTSLNAEFSKLAENSFRDVNIAFANELSMMAENVGADPLEIIALANRHPRVNILNPGPGVGGHCISVDPWFLVHTAPEQTPLIRTAREVNNRKPHHVVAQIEALVEQYDISTVGCLGLAYKADVDDLRESPSLEIVRELHRRGLGELLVCDPFVTAQSFDEFPLLPFREVVDRSELLVLLTDHGEFQNVTAETLRGKHVIDTRGVWRELLQQPASGDVRSVDVVRRRQAA